VQDSLSALLSLSEQEKQARGLIDTPREIHQQPATWRSTLQRPFSLFLPIADANTHLRINQLSSS
jgi:hypothetical protein